MNRRELLAGVVVIGITTSGCVGDAGDVSHGDGDGATGNQGNYSEYERCDNRIVRIDNLPPLAYQEATDAIDDDGYDTTDELLLESVVREDAYLQRDNRYYSIEILDEGNRTVLNLVESIPRFQEEVILENQLGTTVTVKIIIDRKDPDETVIQETITLDASEEIILSDTVEFLYGEYRAKVDGEELSPDGSWEVTWELNHHFEAGYAYPLHIDTNGLFIDPVDRDSTYGPCSWDESGEVSTGH